VASHEQIEELRIKIENFKRTKQLSRGAIREWCDSLICDAEEELRRLTADEQQPLPNSHGRTIPFDRQVE
jgi:hypothetical protein